MERKHLSTIASPIMFATFAIVVAATAIQNCFAQPASNAKHGISEKHGISDNPCGGRTNFFTHYPTLVGGLRGINPLGGVDPRSTHVFPTHHMYLHVPVADLSHPLENPLEEPLYSPGRLELVAVENDSTHADPWDLHLKPCSEVSMYILHVHSLDPAIAAQLDPSTAVSLGDTTVYLTHFDVAAGQPLGTVGIGTLAWDIGLIDLRRPPLPFANPDRYALSDTFLSMFPPELLPILPLIAPQRLYQFCAFDYFVLPVRNALKSLLGSFDGSVRRIAAPICGEHMQDIVGTAQGNWFKNASDNVFFDEGRGVGLVHDNVVPILPAFSVGSSFPNWTPEVRYFTPAATGLVNRDFSSITPGATYCYENLSLRFGTEPGTVLVEVFSSGSHPADRLRIERRATVNSCDAGPYAFGANRVIFQR